MLSFKTDSKKILALALRKVIRQKNTNSLSIVFCTEKEITNLNKKYRNQEKKTDVLSFCSNLLVFPKYLGDIVICYPVAVEQAAEYGHSLRRELSFLFLHGLLHLLGYDHLKTEDEVIMFALQREILENLGIKRS